MSYDSDKVSLIGKNCGNCKRGSLSYDDQTCYTCKQIEETENKKFSQWEQKES